MADRSTPHGPRSSGVEARTRGGWVPVGTAADRRANHSANGTDQGRRTRLKLIDAARRIFERVGYFDASIEDIVAEAQVARGSFYTYFPDKVSVFRILGEEVNQAILDAVSAHPTEGGIDVIQRLDQSNRRFIAVYRQNAAIYGLIEQVGTIDAELRAARLRGRTAHVRRVTASIERWQSRALMDPTVDARTTAAQLVSMTSNFCYWWFVGGEEHDEERAATVLTHTWVRTLNLHSRPQKALQQSPST